MRSTHQRQRVNTQITFKVSQPVAKLLRERGFREGLSCHAAARATLEEALARDADERAINQLGDRLESLHASVNKHTERSAALTENGLDALHLKLNSLEELVVESVSRLDALRSDIRTGVLGILVRTGKPIEAAQEWVEENIGVEEFKD